MFEQMEMTFPDRDPLYWEVGRFLVTSDAVNIGSVQREFRLGFKRADEIMIQLAKDGVIRDDYLDTTHHRALMTEEEFAKRIWDE